MHFLSVCAVSLLLRRLDDKTADIHICIYIYIYIYILSHIFRYIYIYIYIYLSEAVPQGFVPQAPTSQPSFFELPMASVASGGADAPPPPPSGGGIPTKGGLSTIEEEEEEEEEEDNEGPHPAAWTDGRPCLVSKGGCGHPSGYLRKGACRFRG
jgi:hypothetical protein